MVFRELGWLWIGRGGADGQTYFRGVGLVFSRVGTDRFLENLGLVFRRGVFSENALFWLSGGRARAGFQGLMFVVSSAGMCLYCKTVF